MIWNNIQTLSELSYCLWCREEITNKIQITKTNRKKLECNCGCTMFECSSKLWYKIDMIKKEEVTNTSQWYEYKEKSKSDSPFAISSSGNRSSE